MAIIGAVEYWHFYLVGRHFTIFTDHLPLKGVTKLNKPNTRLFNWAIRLCQYNFKVEYKPVATNQEEDYLSRHPVYQLKDGTEGTINPNAITRKTFRAFLHKNDIAIVFTSANHPASSGIVKRVNQTLVQKLKCKRLEKRKFSWTTHLQVIEEYNKTIHSSTVNPPAFLLFGTDPDNLYTETIEETREKVFVQSQAKHQQNAYSYDKHRSDPDIKIGDKMYVQAKHKTNRQTLEPQYESPYLVTDKLSFTTYEVDRKRKIEPFYVSQLKLTKPTSLLCRPLNSIMTLLFLLLLLLINFPMAIVGIDELNFTPAPTFASLITSLFTSSTTNFITDTSTCSTLTIANNHQQFLQFLLSL